MPETIERDGLPDVPTIGASGQAVAIELPEPDDGRRYRLWQTNIDPRNGKHAPAFVKGKLSLQRLELDVPGSTSRDTACDNSAPPKDEPIEYHKSIKTRAKHAQKKEPGPAPMVGPKAKFWVKVYRDNARFPETLHAVSVAMANTMSGRISREPGVSHVVIMADGFGLYRWEKGRKDRAYGK